MPEKLTIALRSFWLSDSVLHNRGPASECRRGTGERDDLLRWNLHWWFYPEPEPTRIELPRFPGGAGFDDQQRCRAVRCTRPHLSGLCDHRRRGEHADPGGSNIRRTDRSLLCAQWSDNRRLRL